MPAERFARLKPHQLFLGAGSLIGLSLCAGGGVTAAQQAPGGSASAAAAQRALLDKYCVTCHNGRMKSGGLALDAADPAHPATDIEVWEKVVRKVRAGMMPPPGRPRPEKAGTDGLIAWLETELDRAALANPDPGRPAALHRLNRTEYRNAVRDLLGLDVDVSASLPADPSSYGFDNNGDALGVVSPVLLERYLSTAQRISRLAAASRDIDPSVSSYVVPSDFTQRDQLSGLPFGTWGGTAVKHHFPLDGEYVFQVRLARNFNTNINALTERHQLEILLDGERLALFPFGGGSRPARGTPVDDDPAPMAGRAVDDDFVVRVPVKAGVHEVAATFVGRPSILFEDPKQPLLRDEPGAGQQQRPAVSRLDIDGPYQAAGVAGALPRQPLFVCQPAGTPSGDLACGRRIISTVARRAFRRPVTDADMQLLMRFYDEGYEAGGFVQGIETALTRILVSPSFLFRLERDPVSPGPAARNFRVSDLELASRLSFFLWSSIPDEELLSAAERRQLKNPAALERQVTRMLRDPRADALVRNFTGQWLRIRDIPNIKPDRFQFVHFDDNLRRALQKETELFADSILRSDRSVVDLLTANHTFLNERLARHYAIPNVYGDHFRRVTLADESRFGLLGQGSLLALTSQPNRTSPVVRGAWVMENILGTPPPSPPADVPPLAEPTASGKVLTMRQRMEVHRANPVCASCHSMMDPIGLSLENFDAVGRWRSTEASGEPLDVSGALPDGSTFIGASGLRQALVGHSGEFVQTMTEKLLTYALGRGLEASDMPLVRKTTKDAKAQNYRFSALVMGIVRSQAFQMKRTGEK